MPQPPLEQWTAIQLVANVNTPPQWQSYDLRIVYIPPPYRAFAGTNANDPGRIGEIDGFLQPGGPTGLQFVMQPPSDLGLEDAPGVGGWTDLNARDTYMQAGRFLINNYGWTPDNTRTRLRALYDAAVANYIASTGG